MILALFFLLPTSFLYVRCLFVNPYQFLGVVICCAQFFVSPHIYAPIGYCVTLFIGLIYMVRTQVI